MNSLEWNDIINKIIIFLSIFSYSYIYLYAINFLNNKKTIILKLKNIVFCIVLSFFLLFTAHYIEKGFFKIFFNFFSMAFLYFCFYKMKLKSIFISNIFFHLLIFIEEIFLTIIFVPILNLDSKFIKNNFVLNKWLLLFINVLILVMFHYTKKYLFELKKNLEKENVLKILGIALIPLAFSFYITISILNYINYKINIIMSIMMVIIIIISLMEKSKKYKVTQENEFLLKNMKVYENIIEKDRIKNHENKNQLIVIKNMVHKNNNKLLNYLDNMNKEKYLKDESILLKLKNIPKGLRGLIYSKIIEAESKNINHFVSIEKNINKITDKFEIKMFNDILNIIGTLFDNAIDAASETEKKIVNFEMFFINDELKIVISNTFSGFINLEKIEKNGYTTKEKGHGYGLSLVNNILNKNKKIFKKTKINNNIFIQEIKIVI